MQIGCISAPSGVRLQVSAFGSALNVKIKKQEASVLLRRKPRKIIITSDLSAQTLNNLLLKENTEFKSSFDEYLKVMERVRDDREKNAQEGSLHQKKVTDVAFGEHGPQVRLRGVRSKHKGFKRSNLGDEDESHKGLHGVVDKVRQRDSAQPRNGITLTKNANVVKYNYASSKKHDGVFTPISSPEAFTDKTVPLSGMSSSNDSMEMKHFLFEPSEDLDVIPVDQRRVSQREMEERIKNLATRLNEADINMPEWMFSKTMRSAKIRFSDTSIMKVIKILGKLGNWRRVLQVVEWLQMQERFKSHKIRYVYTSALDVLGKAKRPVEALNLFRAMQRHMNLYPDIVAYRSVAVTLGQAGHMKELFDVIDSMRSMPKSFTNEVPEDSDPRLEPDIVVYNAVINACAMRKEWEGTFWVLQKLAQANQQPSSTTYGLIMEVMLACGKYDLVHDFFRKLQQHYVPNVLTYRVLVNTLWKEGKPDEAIEAVEDMEKRGLVGSASLYYDLARCLCAMGRFEEALMQVDKICKVASKPLVVTYTGLIKACFDHGHVHDGASIFNHMQKHCNPNRVTCNIMLKAYLGHGMFDEAKELFRKMTHDGSLSSTFKGRVKPDLHTFNVMMEACVKEERWNEFEYAYEQMLLHGHSFNTKRHLWMVLQASHAGKDEVVETTWKHLLQANKIPPPGLIKERFRLKTERDDAVSAVNSIAYHPSSNQQSFSKEAWLKLLDDNVHIFKKETLEQVIYEVHLSLSKSQSPNLIYQNLMQACGDFFFNAD